MQVQLTTVILGLLTAVLWGGGDFCGGLATRKASVITVLLLAETSGLLLLITLGLAWHEPWPTAHTVGWSMAAGFSGVLGLAALYQALAVGKAGVVAPISAILAAALPVLFTALTSGLPAPLQLFGFGLAFVAVWLVAQTDEPGGTIAGLRLALLAGCGFGGFYILINQAGNESTFWPVAVARLVALVPLLGIAFYRRLSVRPTRSIIVIAGLSGLLDAGANATFVLASQSGRLDVAAILSSLYPATTVLLSWLLLGERITWVQRTGVLAALAAIALIAA